MKLPDEVRAHAAQVVEGARWVRIDHERLAAVDHWRDEVPEPALDPERHFLEGAPDDVARYLLTLTTINFGSGWFPTLDKEPGMSGYFTVASRLADRFRAMGPWSNEQLRELSTIEVADTLGQRPDHELMSLFSQALRQLGRFLGERTPLQLVAEAGGSAEKLARIVSGGMSMWNDRGFYKRAQILSSDLALGGVATFSDLDQQTIYADNLVPHVLRCEGILVYDAALAETIDTEQVLMNSAAEREIRASAVHVCALLRERLGRTERDLDMWLWNRGQRPEFKARPRHRARTVFY